VKTILSVLLGVVLLTSLVGISYATPLVQPLQGSGDINACVNLKPNDPNYTTLGCAGAAHQGGDENQPPHNCLDSRIGADAFCVCSGNRLGTDFCCPVGITPHSPEVSDIHPDVPCA